VDMFVIAIGIEPVNRFPMREL